MTLNDGTIVLGSNEGVSWMPTEFFSIRIKESSPASAMRSTARVHLRGQEFELRRLTPGDLQALGIDVRPDDLDVGEQRAFVGTVNRIERAHSNSRSPADDSVSSTRDVTTRPGASYELSWPSRRRFTLPILEERASRVMASAGVGQGLPWTLAAHELPLPSRSCCRPFASARQPADRPTPRSCRRRRRSAAPRSDTMRRSLRPAISSR